MNVSFIHILCLVIHMQNQVVFLCLFHSDISVNAKDLIYFIGIVFLL